MNLLQRIIGAVRGRPAFQIKVLDLKPGDRLLFKFDGFLSLEDVARIRHEWAKYLPESVGILFVDRGADISIIRYRDGTIMRNAA